jgi:hypothetical protein
VGGVEPEIIYSTRKFHYAFLQEAYKDVFSILKIDRETRERKVLFRHETSHWFATSFTLDSIHYSPADEFNPTGGTVLYFTVNCDMDHDRVDHLSRYASVDFAILRPESEAAELVLLRGRTKRKEDSFAATVINEGPQIPWMYNMAEADE